MKLIPVAGRGIGGTISPVLVPRNVQRVTTWFPSPQWMQPLLPSCVTGLKTFSIRLPCRACTAGCLPAQVVPAVPGPCAVLPGGLTLPPIPTGTAETPRKAGTPAHSPPPPPIPPPPPPPPLPLSQTPRRRTV